MHLSLKSLLAHPEAIEKYKDRNVKIFNSHQKYWYGFQCLPTTEKRFATILTLEDAMKQVQFYKRGIRFYFEDSLGEDHFSLRDYDDESIHNNPDMKWDDLKTKQFPSNTSLP